MSEDDRIEETKAEYAAVSDPWKYLRPMHDYSSSQALLALQNAAEAGRVTRQETGGIDVSKLVRESHEDEDD